MILAIRPGIRKRVRREASGPSSASSGFYFGIGFLVPALLTFIGFVIIKVWPFGDGTVLIIDSLHQYLPFYTDFHDKLRRGEDLFYSFSAGFGYDFWSTYAYYMASPLNFLIALVPTANVGDFMDLMILLKIGLTGGTFSWYLHKRDPEAKGMCVVFGTMFALGNFMIGYYFNLMWLDSIAMLPLIMRGIEKITCGEGGRLYGLSLFYGLWCNYYIGFMLCVFSVLYLFVCFLQREGLTLRAFGKRAVRFAWYSLLAGGMACAVLLPAFVSLMGSESMESNSFPSVIKFYTNFVQIILAHFAAEHPINISSTQVGLNAYCGTAVLILVLCYVLDERIRLREKLGYLSLIALLMLSFSLNILNYIWHGFHLQNGLPNRFAFLYVALLLVVCFDVFPHLRRMSLWKLAVSGLIPLAFSLWAVITRAADWETYGIWNVVTPVLLGLYLTLLVILRSGRASRRLFSLLLGGVMLTEALVHGIYGIMYNENVTRSIYLKDQASFKALTAAQGDTDFYRAEIDSQRMRNVTMFAGGHSVVMFNSTMDANVTRFCDRIGMEARTNKNGYNGVTKLMNDVFGIRYVLSSNGKGDSLYQFVRVSQDDNLTMYKNDNALSIGFMCRPEIRYWDTGSGNPIEVQNDFVNLATGREDLYVLDRTVEAQDDQNYQVKIPEDKQVYLYVPNRISSLALNTPEYSRTYDTYTDHLYVINAMDGDELADFTTRLNEGQPAQTISIYTCPNADYQAVAGELAQSQLENVTARGRHLSGEIQVKEAGIMLLSIPYDEDWQITVDGQKVSPLPIGGALTGLELSEGSHTIRMTYTPGGFWVGLALSIGCVSLFILTWIRERREEQRRQSMRLHFAKRTETFQPGIFSVLDEKRRQLAKTGVTIHNLSVGTPDFAPPKAVMEAVSQAARIPENYRYSLGDLPELIEQMRQFYQSRFGVELTADQIMTVNGSQEGLAHLAWALCDPGDVVLVPNPGYPIFKVGPTLCGARVWEYPLLPENHYLPKLEEIPDQIRKDARMMIISYPGNPLCKAAPDGFYREAVRFARENQILLVHDNAYGDICFSEGGGKSLLSFEGAQQVGVEFYSLSKTFDYTGARASFLLGNAQVIQRFRMIRSQIDYGMFLPVQYGAIAALRQPQEEAREQCREYERRSRSFCQALRDIGWPVEDTDGTMFVWAPLPEGYTDSSAFCLELMERSGVICTPGVSFGSLGEGYVRFALVEDGEKLQEAAQAIKDSGILA